MEKLPDIPVTIRSYRTGDQQACKTLYRAGLLGGQLAPNDTGLDIDDIDSAYMKTHGNHLWVAETVEGQIVGMIGVQQHEAGVGEIRRLRVKSDVRRRGIGSKLMEAAVKLCAEQQYLKVALDTFVEPEPAIKLFEKFHFRHERTRQVGGKDLLYFYLDIYGAQRDEKKKE